MAMSPLLLPGLDQVVLLDRGEAGRLAQAVAAHVLAVKANYPISAASVLTCLPLVGLARQLSQLHRREQAAPPKPGKSAKPRTFRISYDKLAALLLNHTEIDCWVGSPLEKLQVQTTIGKFQQKSLNLSQYLTF